MPIKKRDPRHPSFPHGTTTGYQAGCRASYPCPGVPRTCLEAANRYKKIAQLRRAGVMAPAESLVVPAAEVIAHLRLLRSVPNASRVLVGTLAGVSTRTVQDLEAERFANVTRTVRDRLLSVSVQDVEKVAPKNVNRKVIQTIKSLQAQGWSIEWQAQQIGLTKSALCQIAQGRSATITADTHRKLMTLARSLTMKIGPHRCAAQRARKEGWLPLLAYEEDGTLAANAVRDENLEARKAWRTQIAENLLGTVQMSLEGASIGEIVDKLEIDKRQVARYRTDAGLRYLSNRELDPAYEQRAAEWRTALLAYNSALADPFEFLRGMGLMRSRRFNLTPEDDKLPPHLRTCADEEQDQQKTLEDAA